MRDETYEELFATLRAQYHPAVAAVMADEVIKRRAAALKAADTRRRREEN